MAVPSQDFDSLTNDSDLNGQGGGSGWSGNWSGSGAFDVHDNEAQSGSQCVEVTSENLEHGIQRSWSSSSTSGIIGIYMRRKGGNNWRDGQYVYIRSGSTDVAFALFFCSNTTSGLFGARVQSGSNNDLFENNTLSADTWYFFEIEFDCTTDQLRARVDGGTWSSWVNFSSPQTSIDGIKLFKGNINGGSYNIVTDHYWDTISDADSTNVTINPSAQVATFSLPAESVLYDYTLSVATQVATFSIPAYTVGAGLTVSPTAQVATFSIPAYTIDTGGNVSISPSAQVATFSIPAYDVNLDFSVFPNAQVATFSTPSPTIAEGSGVTITPAAQVATFTTPTPTITIIYNVIVSVAAQVLTFTLPTLAKVGGVWTKVARNASDTWSRTSRNND